MGDSAVAQRAELERAVLAAIAALWPGDAGGLGTATLLAHLSDQGHNVPARALYLRLESLQMAGLVRLSRGNPQRAAAEAHGERTITWANPAILD